MKHVVVDPITRIEGHLRVEVNVDEGSGKVTLNVSERYVEKSAIQSGETPILTGAKVRIISVIGDEYLVEKI